MYFFQPRLSGLYFSTVCAAGESVIHCGNQRFACEDFQTISKGALKQAQVNSQAATGVDVWICMSVKQSNTALLNFIGYIGCFLTCSFVVRPRATSTIWKPVSPMTGIKKSPAMHITTRLDTKVKFNNNNVK